LKKSHRHVPCNYAMLDALKLNIVEQPHHQLRASVMTCIRQTWLRYLRGVVHETSVNSEIPEARYIAGKQQIRITDSIRVSKEV
jgi:hypothetical protein